MSKRFKQVNVQHFATLVQEIQISKINQKDFVEIVEEIYMSIFRHNTNGDFVVETLPNEKGNWRVHKPSATKEEVMELIKKGQVIWNKDVI
jgi:hypothetical protein